MKSNSVQCGNCLAVLNKAALVCPCCGVKVKRPIVSRWWFWPVVVLIGLMILGSSGDVENDSSGSIDATQGIVSEELHNMGTYLILDNWFCEV